MEPSAEERCRCTEPGRLLSAGRLLRESKLRQLTEPPPRDLAALLERCDVVVERWIGGRLVVLGACSFSSSSSSGNFRRDGLERLLEAVLLLLVLLERCRGEIMMRPFILGEKQMARCSFDASDIYIWMEWLLQCFVMALHWPSEVRYVQMRFRYMPGGSHSS